MDIRGHENRELTRIVVFHNYVYLLTKIPNDLQ